MSDEVRREFMQGFQTFDEVDGQFPCVGYSKLTAGYCVRCERTQDVKHRFSEDTSPRVFLLNLHLYQVYTILGFSTSPQK